jgi:hypothetical protein
MNLLHVQELHNQLIEPLRVLRTNTAAMTQSTGIQGQVAWRAAVRAANEIHEIILRYAKEHQDG